jgi:hypothetical protein
MKSSAFRSLVSMIIGIFSILFFIILFSYFGGLMCDISFRECFNNCPAIIIGFSTFLGTAISIMTAFGLYDKYGEYSI